MIATLHLLLNKDLKSIRLNVSELTGQTDDKEKLTRQMLFLA